MSKYILPTKITFLFEKIQTCPLFFSHTSYKYISLLLVGRGGYGKNTDNAPNAPQWIGGCMGGDGGMIAYKKNIITSSDGVGGMSWITQIDFRHSMSGSSSPGLYVRYNQSLGNEITAFLGDMSNGQDRRQNYWQFALNGETDSGLFVYGRTEGGLATPVLTAGSGGSYGNGEQTTSTASTMQGGEGGDGRLGTQGPDYNTGIRASETIPIQSVFGGIGTGGLSYFTSTTNCKASGGGGYGEANPNGSAGYGAGATCFKIGSGTNDYNEGAGIVCIYYHDNPI